jgi:antibiotic biosynthesis monooxygenase (ABM) superfamily enzyme
MIYEDTDSGEESAVIVVVSQAWTQPGEEHAQAYVALSEEFGVCFRGHPGYRGRRLVRGLEDRTHFTHLRFFDSVDSYEECTRHPDYQAHLLAMYEHLQPYESYPREYLEVVLDEPGNPG